MHKTIFERVIPNPRIIKESLEGSINKPFWLDDVEKERRDFPSLQGDIEADLAIVGGGFLGLWTAILAKERNPRRMVVLLEGNVTGWSASGRNGGFCDHSITHGEENGRTRWPDEFDQLEALGHKNLDEIEAAIKAYGIDCDFERTGVLTVAVEPYQDRDLQGPDYLCAEKIRAEVNSPTFLSGHWRRSSTAMVHPGKLVLGLTRVAREFGVRIYERSQVKSIEDRNNKLRIKTDAGSVDCQRLVLATNAFPSLLRRYSFHTIPVYDYVLMSEPLNARQMDLIGWKNRQGIGDMGNQFHYYRITKGNRILFGGYDAVYYFCGKVDSKYDSRPESFERLASHFFTTFPQLEGLKFTHRWGGAIDTSSRFCAFFTQAYGGKAAYAAGFTGLGVGATRFAANVLLDMTDGIQTERTRLKMVQEVPMPFPPEPLTYPTVQAVRWSLNRADHNEGRRNILLRTLDSLGLGFDS